MKKKTDQFVNPSKKVYWSFSFSRPQKLSLIFFFLKRPLGKSGCRHFEVKRTFFFLLLFPEAGSSFTRGQTNFFASSSSSLLPPLPPLQTWEVVALPLFLKLRHVGMQGAYSNSSKKKVLICNRVCKKKQQNNCVTRSNSEKRDFFCPNI